MNNIDDKLPIMEAFYTLQGEGVNAGMAAYFIRLGGCSVRCHWCDVPESWNKGKHPLISIDDIVKEALNSNSPNIVITGGEPLTHNLDILTNKLKEKNLKTFIETSGVFEMSGTWDWICFSPKKFKDPHNSIYPVANELKVIVFNKSDFEFAEYHASKVSDNCKLYLQPEWDKSDIVLPLIIEYIKQNPKWRLSLQTHKYINIP